MCKASEVSNKIVELLEDAIGIRQSLVSQLSDLDRKLSDAYHDLEFVEMNAYQGYKIAKYIQSIVQERRAIKKELHSLNSFVDSITASGLKQKFETYAQKADKLHKSYAKPKPRGSFKHIS
ncbi:hypothetical protein [Brevibacillus brevis]|uniref:hypothetical protein n=1 Tax=Brevibacillus brevis TaxID=1393 RepID=UPI0007D8B28B|nr:hypothetical protein [Brevibacillus brevis]